MIRLQCPHCDKKLSINDDLAGRVGLCPGCKNKIQIPQPETTETYDVADEAISAAPRLPRPQMTRRPAADDDEEDEKPVRRSRQTADDEEDEDDKPLKRSYRPGPDADEDVSRRRRRREEDDGEEDFRQRTPKGKKRRRRRSSGSLFESLSIPHYIVIGVVGLSLLLTLVSFFVPAVALVPIGLGYLLMLIGGVWLLVIAFMDSAVQGVLCLLVPFYGLYYLISHFEDCKQAFFLELIGLGIVMVGGCAGGIGGAMQGPPPQDFRQRLQAPVDPAAPPLNKDGATKIVGGGNDPQFKDVAPEGHMLVGFEFGLSANGNSIKAVRALYRSSTGAEVKGMQIGNNLERIVTVKAKNGYAVGSLTARAGLWLDGVTVNFMKVKGGQLDPFDAYAGPHAGGMGGGQTTLGGDGSLVIGVIGRTNNQGTNGIGLLLKKKD